jgi:redox-regulated HSP33 family molecular chaperone
MSADLKQTMKLILQIKWETGGFSLEADWNGNIRGYVRDPEVIESRFHSEEVLGGTLAIIRMIGANPRLHRLRQHLRLKSGFRPSEPLRQFGTDG